MDDNKGGRANQRQRTRKDLLKAASHLLKQGRKPTLEEVAEQALVSRATTYRYFPNIDALLNEASLDIETPEPDALFADERTGDPVARVERVDDALQAMILANESSLRMMLAQSMQRQLDNNSSSLPARQNRRTPLLELALEPARSQFRPAALKTLTCALAVLIGTESFVVFRDVLQIDDKEAQKVRRWAIRALIDAARKPD